MEANLRGWKNLLLELTTKHETRMKAGEKAERIQAQTLLP